MLSDGSNELMPVEPNMQSEYKANSGQYPIIALLDGPYIFPLLNIYPMSVKKLLLFSGQLYTLDTFSMTSS